MQVQGWGGSWDEDGARGGERAVGKVGCWGQMRRCWSRQVELVRNLDVELGLSGPEE